MPKPPAFMRQWQRRRLLARASTDMVTNLVLPDGVEGYVHVDYVLLQPDSLVVLEFMDGEGKIFAGEKVQEWALLGRRRFSLPNPLQALKRKTLAVQGVAGTVLPKSWLVVAKEVQFPRGRPTSVVYEHELGQVLKPSGDLDMIPFQLSQGWDRLRAIARQHEA